MTTTNKGLNQPAYNSAAWDVPLNSNFGYIDTSLGGILNLNATGASSPASISFDDSRNLIISISGTLTMNIVYTLPLNATATGIVGGQWIVYNNTSGAYSVTIAPVSGAGTSVTCSQGVRTIIYSDGTNVAVADDRVVPDVIPSGTAMLFIQTSAPTGWTKSTAHNNKALRVVSGTAASGGSVDFTTAFASQAVSGNVGNTTLTIDQIPSHTHTINKFTTNSQRGDSGELNSFSGYLNGTATSNAVGGGQSHTHTFTGTAINLAVSYVDAIIATKD